LVVFLTSAFWFAVGKDRSERELIGVAKRLAALTLPTAEAPPAMQSAAAGRLAEALRADLALIDRRGGVVFATPAMRRHMERKDDDDHHDWQHEWQRRDGGFSGGLRLADGRRLVVRPPRGARREPIYGLVVFIGIIGLAVAVGAWPFTRRLTRRLETLREGVERMGAGDLSARVDISGKDEVTALATAFNDAAAEIERLTAARRLLLANASHELRTPLARARLGAEMLENRADPARFDALRQDLAEIEELIETLLLSTRLDAQPEIDRNIRVDLLALAAEEAAHYDDVELDGEAMEIPGDAALLRRLIRNLLQNAMTHGAPPVSLKLTKDGAYAIVSVHDEGPGFTADTAQMAFEPFQRGKNRQNTPGYGLGLAIVQQIAKAHGGEAGIQPGPGGRVTVRLFAS
jgi:signal transduction histidine kinase